MNLGETEEERRFLDEFLPMIDQARHHLNHMVKHYQEGDYKDITAHAATLCAGLLTFSEEFVITIMSDDDMASLVQDGILHSEGAQFGRMILLRQWWEEKRVESNQQGEGTNPSDGELGQR